MKSPLPSHWIALLLALCLGMLLSACGGSDDDGDGEADAAQTNEMAVARSAVDDREMQDDMEMEEEMADDQQQEEEQQDDQAQQEDEQQQDDQAQEEAGTEDDQAAQSPPPPPSSGPKVLAIGDSITVGFGAESWARKLGRFRGVEVAVEGVNGEKAGGVAGRIGGAIARHNPTHVLILTGTNNAVNDDLNVGGAIGSALDTAIASGVKTIVGTIPPTTGPQAGKAGNVATVNGQIQAAAGARGIRVANVNSAFGGRASLMQADGFHPNDSGQNVIAVTFGESF